jgi:hypothetical protein
MIFCSNCGKGIPRDSRFCTFCGAVVQIVDPKTEKPVVNPNAAPVHQNAAPVNPTVSPFAPKPAQPETSNPSASIPADHSPVEKTTVAPVFQQPTYSTVPAPHTQVNPHAASAGAHSSAAAHDAMLPFHMNPGFYGALLVLAGYPFLWLNNWENTGIDLIQYFAPNLILTAIGILVPAFCALIILIQVFTGVIAKATYFFKWLPFLMITGAIATATVLAYDDPEASANWITVEELSLQAIAWVIGAGLYITWAGSLIMLFTKRVRRRP